MSELNQLRVVLLLSLSLFFCALRVGAQQTPAATSSPNASPSSTPAVFSPQTLAELKRLQQAALTSDYAYRQVAHLSNNIGPRLTGSAQAAKAAVAVKAERDRRAAERRSQRERRLQSLAPPDGIDRRGAPDRRRGSDRRNRS